METCFFIKLYFPLYYYFQGIPYKQLEFRETNINLERFFKMKRINLIVMGLVLLLPVSAQLDSNQYISLEEAKATAIENNSNIRLSELDRKIANAQLHQTDAIFLPQITAGYTAMTTNNPLNAFGFLLQQEQVTASDFDPAKLNNPGASQNYSAQIEAKLPLVNLDLIFARKGAKAQEDTYRYRTQRTKEYIEFEVEKAYTVLQMAYRAKQLLEESLADVKGIHQSVSNFYEQGLLQKSDLLNAQVQVNTVESALTKAKSNIQNVSDGLHLLMGDGDSRTTLKVDSLKQNYHLNNQLFNEGRLHMRADVMALKKALEATNMMVKSSRMAFIPRINAFGSYGWNDAKIAGFKSDSYLVGINLSWTLFSGNKNRSQLRMSKFQRSKMQEELSLHLMKSKIELSKTRRSLDDSQTEIETQQISVEQAEEALRILANRHQEGLVNTTDLLMAQAQLYKQKLLLHQAIMSYNITESYLNFLNK